MKFDRLIKEVRLELSEAVVADKEKNNTRARLCLEHAKRLLFHELNMKKGV